MAVKLEFEEKSKLLLNVNDSAQMIKRSSRHIYRHTDQLLGTFFQPIMFLLLFATVFGGAIEASLPEGINYLDFLMAGILVQTVAFGSGTTAIAVTNDLGKGIIDRFKSLPMSNLAVLNGYVVSDMLRNSISSVVMILAGLAIGFRTSASFTDWLIIAGILLLFTFSFSWLMAIPGIVAKSIEGVQWITFVFILPLTFASSAFVPTESMPAGLGFFAENQPLTKVIEAIRALILGNPASDYIVATIIWSIVITAVALPLAVYLYKTKKTQ